MQQNSDKKHLAFDKIDNLALIENNLAHLDFELSRKKPSYFRVAREAHQILYRIMIESLKGTANSSITYKRSEKGIYNCKYQIGNMPWKEIHKIKIDECKKAWRFSNPENCQKPQIEEISGAHDNTDNEDYLIGFYYALSMIQTECFMCRYMNSNVVTVSNQNMKELEWLHERIRNEYEHFIPKLYMAPIEDLLRSAIISIELSSKLLFDSGNIILYRGYRGKITRLCKIIIKKLDKINSRINE